MHGYLTALAVSHPSQTKFNSFLCQQPEQYNLANKWTYNGLTIVGTDSYGAQASTLTVGPMSHLFCQSTSNPHLRAKGSILECKILLATAVMRASLHIDDRGAGHCLAGWIQRRHAPHLCSTRHPRTRTSWRCINIKLSGNQRSLVAPSLYLVNFCSYLITYV